MGKFTVYAIESHKNNMLSNREIETKAIFHTGVHHCFKERMIKISIVYL